MFNVKETATILAALLYWREEMSPHDTDVMRPYFAQLELAHVTPLSADEIDRLIRRLRAAMPDWEAGDTSTHSDSS